MSSNSQAILSSWFFDPKIAFGLAVSVLLYTRGWLILHRTLLGRFPVWRLIAFVGGLATAWLAIASPLDAFSGLLLSAHMVQHLLLMSVAAPLILLGAPLLPLLRGLPRKFARDGVGPFLTWPALRQAGNTLTHPWNCWLLMAVTLCAWHVPAAFDLALRSPAWHKVEHACFLGGSLLFWWPVVRPFPSRPQWPLWSVPFYLLAADLLNTALSAILTFSDHVLYPTYSAAPRLFGTTALGDQTCAGLIMWVPGSLVYLVPAAILAIQYLSAGRLLVRPQFIHMNPRVGLPPVPVRSSVLVRIFHTLAPTRGRNSKDRQPRLVPEGPLRIAQRFSVGNPVVGESSPEGTAELGGRGNAISRPSGTQGNRARDPMLKHWAIFDRPSGTKRRSIFRTALGLLPVRLFQQSKPRPASTTGRRFDLLAVPLVGPFLRSQSGRRILQATLFIGALAVIVDGLFGPQVSSANLAGVLPWVCWRAFVIVALLAAGNFFCMACPFMLFRELGRRLGLRQRSWPRALRSKWFAVALLVLFYWAYEVFSLWDKPIWTAWLIINYFLAAFAIDALFSGASFCKYVCPIGQFQFVASLVSPLEVKVRKPDVCASCKTHDCLRGNEHQRGCEMDLHLPRKSGNLDCTFCLDCVRACPHDNIGVLAVAPGMDIVRDQQRSSVGRLSRRRDITALALVFVFAAFANAALMVTPISSWRDLIAANLKLSSTLPVTSALFLALFLVPLTLVGASVMAGRALAGAKVSTHEMIGRFSLALVPLASAMWAAHYLSHFLLGWDSVLPVFQRVLGDLGWAVSQSSWPAAGPLISMDQLRILQTVLLDIGLLATLYLGWRIARVHASKLRSAFGMMAPWGSVAVCLYAFGIWTCLQPMQMRGMAATLSSMDAQDDWTCPRGIAAGVHARAEARLRSCPEGTSDNSPTLQRWVTVRQDVSPEGTTESGSIQPPLRDSIATVLDPNAEALGYSQVSLRDREGFGTAERGVLDL